MADIEKLGAFYLGRRYDVEKGEVTDEPVVYDAKDLTTHAVCVGMTGSGKTGLGVALLEEAAIDGIPIIAIDPKGDLGSLLLAFPDLSAADFRPWIDESEAARKGRTPEEQAAWTADLWRDGLADWDQGPQRIRRYRDSVDAAIYTPGSSAGRPLTILKSFSAPPPAVAEDPEALAERTESAVSGLLGLLGIRAEPLRSREHILLSNIINTAWREGRDLDLPSLIREIQEPPFERVGVIDLESFYPSAERFELSMSLNNLLASPGFAAWTQGEPLDIGKLLYTSEGKPRLSIISIAHLSESERMFFVTLLLGEVLSWVRSQPGTRSLRAILYMDEVFGYFPPSANPPSKKPMLTLLKQARAFGLGCVLATQNPVDLDYKGLSNAGTWFLGRLQTERDKARVIEGLEGASAGAGLDRATMERILSGLDSRVFLMNNVHEDGPVVMHTRWVLSYLAGPMTRSQIKTLTDQRGRGGEADAGRQPLEAAKPRREEAATRPKAGTAKRPADAARGSGDEDSERPMVPPDIEEVFLPVTKPAGPRSALLYRPTLLATATLHYTNTSAKVDQWRTESFLLPVDAATDGPDWDALRGLGKGKTTAFDEPSTGARFGALPGTAARAKEHTRWRKMLASRLYREHKLRLWHCKELKLYSQPGESEREFRGRLREVAREARDLEVEKLRDKYAPKLARIKDQIRRADDRVEREQEQYKQQKIQTAISVGTTVLGVLFGRKLGTATNVGRAGTAMRGAGRAARERGDIGRAAESLEASQEKLEALERELVERLEEIREEYEPDALEAQEIAITAKKTEIAIDRFALAWAPWNLDPDGVAEPAFG